MKRFVIEDWCGNILFNTCFKSEDEALEHAYNKLDEDEIEDILIVPKEGEIKGGKFYID